MQRKLMRLMTLAILAMLIFGYSTMASLMYIDIGIELNKKNTYLESVTTPSYPEIKDLLLELNTRGYGEIVKTNGTRPIIIVEQQLSLEYNTKGIHTLASTLALPFSCIIYVDPIMFIDQRELLKSTIWHEYLHCFNYGHSPDSTDIMYWLNSSEIDINSVDNYLQELKELYE